MEENRKGPGVFYAVVGVATLVVAIIGATFAYFSAAATDQTFEGVTATAGSLTLAVTDVWPLAAEAGEEALPDKLIPLDAEGANPLLATALKSTNACRDKNNDVACHVYQIDVTNDGDSSVFVTTTMKLGFTGNDTNTASDNWRWQVITASTTDVGGYEATGTKVSGADVETAKTVGGETLAGGATGTYYVVVWLEDINNTQTETAVTFTGTVSAKSTDASGVANGVTATFNS